MIEQVRKHPTAARTAEAPSVERQKAVSQAASEQAVCPKCGAPMVRRVAKQGANAGSSFLGCTRFPACRGTRNMISQSKPADG
jgi:restriction system protein